MKKKKQQIEITIHEISCHSTTLPYKIETDYQKKEHSPFLTNKYKKITRFQVKKAVLCSEHSPLCFSKYFSSFDFIIEMGHQKI